MGELVGVVAVWLRRREPRQQRGEREAVVLAVAALATRLDREEARDARGDRDEIGGVVEHDEPGGAEPGTGRAHRLVAQGRVERARGQQRVGDPRQDRDELATGPRAATDLLDHLAQRRAELDLGDARCARCRR